MARDQNVERADDGAHKRELANLARRRDNYAATGRTSQAKATQAQIDELKRRLGES